MALHADAVDVACRKNRLQDLQNLVGFRVAVVIVVVQVNAFRGVFAGVFEGIVHKVGAHNLIPEALRAEAVGIALAGVHRLVYHVIAVYHAGVSLLHVGHDLADVALHALEHNLAAYLRASLLVVLGEEPFGRLLVPKKRVEANRDAVLLRVLHAALDAVELYFRLRVRVRKSALASLDVQNLVGLGLVFEGHAVEVRGNLLRHGLAGVEGIRNGNTDLEIVLVKILQCHLI